jgi:hypothetical protein
MEFKYKKLMEENDLTLNQLPEDAQTGVAEINKVLRAISMLEKSGKKVSAGALKKVTTMDKWVTYEILDYLHDTDKNDDDMPIDADDVIDELNKDGKNKHVNKPIDKPINEPIDNIQVDQVGLRIEEELDRLFESGKTSYTIDEIRGKANKTYKELWDSYEEDEQNGIVTTKYSLIEDKEKNFNLTIN